MSDMTDDSSPDIYIRVMTDNWETSQMKNLQFCQFDFVCSYAIYNALTSNKLTCLYRTLLRNHKIHKINSVLTIQMTRKHKHKQQLKVMITKSPI